MASSVLRHDGLTVYYAISDLPMTWDEAYEYRNSEMGYLAEPRSPEETEEINKLVDGRNAWIGLTDKGTEALFLWVSDGQNTESYHNWDGFEPSGDGDCVNLRRHIDELLLLLGMLKICMRMLAQAVTKLSAGKSSLSQTRKPSSSPFFFTSLANSSFSSVTALSITVAHSAMLHSFWSSKLDSPAAPVCTSALVERQSQSRGVGFFLLVHSLSIDSRYLMSSLKNFWKSFWVLYPLS